MTDDDAWELARNFAIGGVAGSVVMAFYGAGADGALYALVGAIGGLVVGLLAFWLL